MAVPSPSPPYSISALEGAVVAFIGAFAGALTLVGSSLTGSAEVGLVSAAAYLGYHAYQSS
jgi:hypothetical protein